MLHRLGIAAGRGLSYYVCKLLHRLRCWEFSLKSCGLNADNNSRTIIGIQGRMNMARSIMLLVIMLSGCQHMNHNERKPMRQITELNINTEWTGDQPKVQANITMRWSR